LSPADDASREPPHPLATARSYVAAGLSVIPVRTDGSKAPAITGWRAYSERRPTEGELRSWFASGAAGIGIPGGPASGNLVVFDFETPDSFRRWCDALDGDMTAALASSPVVCTPGGGRHIYLRLAAPAKGCKLARTTEGKTVVEVRGSQHYVV